MKITRRIESNHDITELLQKQCPSSAFLDSLFSNNNLNMLIRSMQDLWSLIQHDSLHSRFSYFAQGRPLLFNAYLPISHRTAPLCQDYVYLRRSNFLNSSSCDMTFCTLKSTINKSENQFCRELSESKTSVCTNQLCNHCQKGVIF